MRSKTLNKLKLTFHKPKSKNLDVSTLNDIGKLLDNIAKHIRRM